MIEERFDIVAQAIIVQACKDYRKCLKKLKKNPYHRDSQYMKDEIETFFNSRYFELLTPVDGEFIMQKIRKEYGYDS